MENKTFCKIFHLFSLQWKPMGSNFVSVPTDFYCIEKSWNILVFLFRKKTIQVWMNHRFKRQHERMAWLFCFFSRMVTLVYSMWNQGNRAKEVCLTPDIHSCVMMHLQFHPENESNLTKEKEWEARGWRNGQREKERKRADSL